VDGWARNGRDGVRGEQFELAEFEVAGSWQSKEGPRTAEERKMSTKSLQTILGYLNIGLAIAHDTGVTLGHFGSTDFIQLAESVNTLLLSAFAPASSGGTGSTASTGSASSTVASAAVVSVAPVALVAVG
jgi:hypothetical protein